MDHTQGKKRKQEKDLKERQDLKETMRIMSHQIKNVNKEIKITKKKKNGNSGVERCNNWNKKFMRWVY